MLLFTSLHYDLKTPMLQYCWPQSLSNFALTDYTKDKLSQAMYIPVALMSIRWNIFSWERVWKYI